MADHNQGGIGEAAKELASKALAGIKAIGAEISDASKDAIHSVKTDSKADDTRKKIDEEFQKLGELAYQSGNLTGQMGEIADKIRKLYVHLQDIEIARNDPNIKIGQMPGQTEKK